MKRTTIYLEPELEVLLEKEMRRRRQPMAALVREALRAYLVSPGETGPPGAGAFASGRADTAADVDASLRDTSFGEPR